MMADCRVHSLRALFVLSAVAASAAAQIPLFEEAAPPGDTFGYARRGGTQPTEGNVSVVVLFAQFSGEGSRGEPPPAFASRLFDGAPGSFNHFYDAMSFGRLRVHGVVLPARYASRFGAPVYVSHQAGEMGQYGRFVQEVLRAADSQVDFRLYDNDGPDGLPDSGDDDGVVDYLFVILRSVPEGFIVGRATGVAGLGWGSRKTSRPEIRERLAWRSASAAICIVVPSSGRPPSVLPWGP
jgi:hypothetical protein